MRSYFFLEATTRSSDLSLSVNHHLNYWKAESARANRADTRCLGIARYIPSERLGAI